jgi:hypothetical protein
MDTLHGIPRQECPHLSSFNSLVKSSLVFLTKLSLQKADDNLKHCFKRNAVLNKGLDVRLIDNTYMVCKDGRMIFLKPLQRHAVLW